jgi:hypothetical protein
MMREAVWFAGEKKEKKLKISHDVVGNKKSEAGRDGQMGRSCEIRQVSSW